MRVGQWVVVLPSDEFYCNADKDYAQQIVEIDKRSSLPYLLKFPDGEINSYSQVRKATRKEIAIAKDRINRLNDHTVSIGGFKCKYYDDYFSFGCQNFTLPILDSLIDLLSRDIGVTLTIDGISVTLPDLQKIKKFYE